MSGRRLTVDERRFLTPLRREEYDRLVTRVADAKRAVADSERLLGDAFWSDAQQPERVRLFGTVDAAETTLQRFLDSVSDQLAHARAAARRETQHATESAARARLVAIAEETESVHAELRELDR
jgi:hypothetical protein